MASRVRDDSETVDDTIVAPPPTMEGEVTPAATLEPPVRAQPFAGSRIGQYTVIGHLGRGGVGDVYRARDERLEREVAIKVLRGVSAAGARARLLAEAQAMAKLSHPNVVTVHEVGEIDDRVYLVMELVQGQTLSEWLAARPRATAEAISMFLQAGRGLAAAHRAGMVHRDFKPTNVLVGEDGRARVSDFGLARPAEVASSGNEGISGTPAYMAPEQHLRHPVDARADQFAFCVALYQALYNCDPFDGDRYADFRDNVVANRVKPPPAGRTPAWLRPVVLRGLSADPAERYPSMDLLLARLAHDPVARRRRLAALAGLLAITGLAVFAVARVTVPAMRPCRGAGERLAGAWDDTVRAAVRRAFLATGRPYAEDTFVRVSSALDSYSKEWATQRRDACEATAVRREQSSSLLDLRMACLDGRLAEFRALTAVLARAPDADVLEHAAEATHRLSGLAECADVAALTRADPEPKDPASRAALAVLRTRIAEVRALHLAGKYRDALPLAQTVADDAARTGFAPVEVPALVGLSIVQGGLKDTKAQRVVFERVLQAAARAHDDAESARTLASLIFHIGAFGAQPAEALPMIPLAQAAVARAGDPIALRAALVAAIGRVQQAQGDFRGAEVALRLAAALISADPEAQELDLASIENRLGIVLKDQEKDEDALTHYQRARALYEKVLGPAHPFVAGMRNNIGSVLRRQSRPDAARAEYEHALAIWEAAYGPEAGDVASALTNLGDLSRAQGRLDEAERELSRAVAIKEKVWGADSPRVGGTLLNLGELYVTSGRLDEAEKTLSRCVAIFEKAAGPDHPNTAGALVSLANVMAARGRAKEALPLVDRGLAVAESKLPPTHSIRLIAMRIRATVLRRLGKVSEAVAEDRRSLAADETVQDAGETAATLTELALGLLELHRAAEARPLLERALALREASAEDAKGRGTTRFALAVALAQTGADLPRARALAVQARQEWGSGGQPQGEKLEQAFRSVARAK